MRDRSSLGRIRQALLVTLACLLAPAAEAQVGGRIRTLEGEEITSSPDRLSRETLSPAQRKISRMLRRKAARMRELGITAVNADDRGASSAFSTSLVRVDNRARIQVYVQVTAIDDALLATIESVGNALIEVVNRELNLIQARIPHDRLGAVATLGSVVRIKPPSYGFTRTGSVNSEGDVIHNADDARLLPGGPTGSGVKVGVISDGSDGSATAIGTADLPPTITTFGTSLLIFA